MATKLHMGKGGKILVQLIWALTKREVGLVYNILDGPFLASLLFNFV